MDPKAQAFVQLVVALVILVIGWRVFKRHWDDGQWWVQLIGFICLIFFCALAIAIGVWGDDIMRGEIPRPVATLKNH